METADPGFSPHARALVDILRPHTPFAEAIVRRQAERAGLSPSRVTAEDLAKLVPLVVLASQAFVDPDVIQRLRSFVK